MAVPASKTTALRERLSDKALYLSEFELHGIGRQLKSILETGGVARVERMAALDAMAQVEFRLNRLDENFRCVREMYTIAPGDPSVVVAYGMGLVNMREYAKAGDLFAQIAGGAASAHRPNAAIMISVVHARLGDPAAAVEAYRRAVPLIDMKDRDQVFLLAAASGEVGLQEEAIELFARYLSLVTGTPLGNAEPMEFITEVNQSRPELFWILDQSYPLQAAIAERLRLPELFADFEREAVESGAEAPSEPPEILKEMEHLREEATVGTVAGTTD
jgi:tetratricopeptide (TPR) repeat protein